MGGTEGVRDLFAVGGAATDTFGFLLLLFLTFETGPVVFLERRPDRSGLRPTYIPLDHNDRKAAVRRRPERIPSMDCGDGVYAPVCAPERALQGGNEAR